MPEQSDLYQSQETLADYLRDPGQRTAPDGLEQRRLDVYSGLIYNNIENFLSGGFPILHKVLPPELWDSLARGFIRDHHSCSPYFLEISQEFLQYLGEERGLCPGDPPYMLELAHYEWVELALDVAETEFSDFDVDTSIDLLEGVPFLSPLAWSLRYAWPVHRIGPGYEADLEPLEATFLVVYRNSRHEVGFLESNSVTSRLIELIGSGDSSTGREILVQMASEMGREDVETIVQYGSGILEELKSMDIVPGCLTDSLAQLPATN